MNIERILKLSKQVDTDKECLNLIISNRITHYLGDKDGAAVGSKNWEILCDDLLAWHESKVLSEVEASQRIKDLTEALIAITLRCENWETDCNPEEVSLIDEMIMLSNS
tara:strand:+ start:2040 stop:2366 length:327 start_codon:yes stop_codon:yes gene_type:complete